MIRVLLLWWLTLPLWAASNIVEEEQLTAELTAGIGHGKPMWLKIDDRPFLTILDEARTAEMKGLVILLPEAGLGTDGGLMGTLRQILPTHGWSTLSLQLPLLEAEARPEEYLALLPEASARTRVAVARMTAAGMGNIALAGHGFGALAVLRYLSGDTDEVVRAVVLLSPWWPQEMTEQLEGWLKRVSVPVLDVRGERDTREILRTATQRHLILKGRHGYRQWRIAGVGHHYRGREALLAKRIYGWLQRVAPGMEVPTDD